MDSPMHEPWITNKSTPRCAREMLNPSFPSPLSWLALYMIFCRIAHRLDCFKSFGYNEADALKPFEHVLNFAVTSAECVHVFDLKEAELRPLMQGD